MSDTQSSRETQAPADDPIERVAAALRARAFVACSNTTLALEVNGIRAALRELREPSPAMIGAAVIAYIQENRGIEYVPAAIWRAMVDALLVDQEK